MPRNKKIDNSVKLTINDIEIERVYQNKFLGVIIDSKLNWKPHAVNVKSKVSKTVAILYKIKDLVNKESLYTLYCSLILPYLTYCVEVWGNTYKTILQPIFILQKKAIRIINKTEYLAATNPLFIHNNTLKLEDIVKFNTATFMYKINNNLLPPSIQELFQTRETQYNLRGTCVLKQKLVRTNTKARCLSIKGVDALLFKQCKKKEMDCFLHFVFVLLVSLFCFKTNHLLLCFACKKG